MMEIREGDIKGGMDYRDEILRTILPIFCGSRIAKFGSLS